MIKTIKGVSKQFVIIILNVLFLSFRVIELEKKREKIAIATEHMNNMEIKNEQEDEESDGSDLDEFIDWRSKS